MPIVRESPDFGRILKGNSRAVHDGMQMLWRTVNAEIEARRRQDLVWRAQPFDANAFTASAGTWTVALADQVLFQYIFAGTLMLVSFVLTNTTTGSGMGTQLFVRLPLSVSAFSPDMVGVVAVTGNITEVGVIRTRSGANANILALERAGGSSWPSSVTDDLDVHGSIALEIG